MLPTLKVSGPLEPERITAGSAPPNRLPTFPVRIELLLQDGGPWEQTLWSLRGGRSRGVSCHLDTTGVSNVRASISYDNQFKRGK